jgi:hypothetical protein
MDVPKAMRMPPAREMCTDGAGIWLSGNYGDACVLTVRSIGATHLLPGAMGDQVPETAG